MGYRRRGSSGVWMPIFFVLLPMFLAASLSGFFIFRGVRVLLFIQRNPTGEQIESNNSWLYGSRGTSRGNWWIDSWDTAFAWLLIVSCIDRGLYSMYGLLTLPFNSIFIQAPPHPPPTLNLKCLVFRALWRVWESFPSSLYSSSSLLSPVISTTSSIKPIGSNRWESTSFVAPTITPPGLRRRTKA